MKYNKAMADSLRLNQFLKENGVARRSVPSQKARTGEDWYPSVRLFRQKKAGEWQVVMNEVTVELKKSI